MSHLLGNKISGFVYASIPTGGKGKDEDFGDVGAFVKSYAQKSIPVTLADIKFQSLLSLLSGSTVAFIRGYYDYISNGNARVFPFEFYGVRVPDINSYINARGLSLEFVSGYRYSNHLYFDLAYEFVWKGQNTHEVTPTIHYNLASLWPKTNELWVHWDLILAKGIGSNLELDWQPFEQNDPSFWQRLSYFATINLYNGLTLYGERNMNRVHSNSVLAFNGFIGVRLHY